MVDDAYAGLRNKVLTTKPAEIGLQPAPDEIWGVLVETALPEAVVSLVAIADGTVSLYFSNGSGIIGLGSHPGPQRVGRELIALARQFADRFLPTTRFPLPEQGATRFYLLSGAGVLEAEAQEDDLGHRRHPLSPLFYKGQELLSAIRIVEEQRSAASDSAERAG
jgi:hypothetical protein